MKNPFRHQRVTKESTVERYLVQRVTQYGGMIRKVVFLGHRGAPDRVVIFPGVLVWVELKRATGVISAMQDREHARLRVMGQRVEMPRTKHEVDRLVEELYNAGRWNTYLRERAERI